MADLTDRLKQQAAELGFAACGIVEAGPSHSQPWLLSWLQRGLHAAMAWMGREDAVAKRADIRLVVPGARSVVCVAMHYRTQEPWDAATRGNVARYARGLDYHDVMTQRLRRLLLWLQAETPCHGRVYVDTGPILEREWAQRAGLGWIGKNTMLLSRSLGSYFLLGEMIVDVELSPDRPHVENYCGSCTRCMDACPTDAFPDAYVLDANKCISYHTIENRGEIPEPVAAQSGDWIFGCDICQEVCPWNDKSKAHSAEPDLWHGTPFPSLLESLMLDQSEFADRFKGSPVKRTKLSGLKRNSEIAVRNRLQPSAERERFTGRYH